MSAPSSPDSFAAGGWDSELEEDLAPAVPGATSDEDEKDDRKSSVLDFDNKAGASKDHRPRPPSPPKRVRADSLKTLDWANRLLEYFAPVRDRLGKQLCRIVMASGCTGMWSEGLVAEARVASCRDLAVGHIAGCPQECGLYVELASLFFVSGGMGVNVAMRMFFYDRY
jgi:hypothetical protein